MSFYNSYFYGIVLKGYNSPTGNYQPLNDNNLRFYQSVFSEEDLSYSYNTLSIDQCGSGCTGDFNYMINFTNASRATFTQCQFITNKYMKWGTGGGGYFADTTDWWNHMTFYNPIFINHGFEVCGNCNNIELCNFGENWWRNGSHVRCLGLMTFNWPYNLTGGVNCTSTNCSTISNPNYRQYWFYWNLYCGDANGAWANVIYGPASDDTCRPVYNDTYYLSVPPIFISCDPCQSSCCEGANEPTVSPTQCINNFRTRNINNNSTVLLERISPNPILDFFVIQSEERIESVAIYNLNGICLGNISSPGTMEYKVNVSDWSPGVYFISVNSKRHYKVIKI